MSTDDRPLALRETARRLGVTPAWLLKEAEIGTVPCLRAGTCLLFNLAAVRRALLRAADAADIEVPTAPIDPGDTGATPVANPGKRRSRGRDGSADAPSRHANGGSKRDGGVP